MNNGTTERLRLVQMDIRAALAEVGKKHNLTFAMGTLSYNELYFTVPLKGRFLDAQGSTEEADKEEFKLYAHKFGLNASMFGQTVRVAAKLYRIVGIAPKARKYPVIGENAGKKYKLPAEDVRFAFAQAQKENDVKVLAQAQKESVPA